eukprot:gnl/Dysnectes_brevis/5214_a7395_656.p1 GENE.gnl/Dysnectes_brevis/5214_a7395_656~~gnl/Dysnectes_brevis/5214_a7395_656.p1  ORF type:complete len:384 (-),score=40.77 gnl/Dysnectes_brevis/5214_a7395_656:33-1130(-)
MSRKSADILDPHILQLYTESANYNIFGVSWIPQSARIVSVGMSSRGTGPITVWSMTKNKLVKDKEHDKAAAFKCVTFGASVLPKRQFATGDHDGRLFLWDVEDMSRPVWYAKAHNGMVNCVDGVGGRNPSKYGSPEIATGGADGTVHIWDERVSRPVASLKAPEGEGSARAECWTVAFGGSEAPDRCVAAGYDSGDLKLWDLRTMEVSHSQHFPNGIVSAEFDRSNTSVNKLVLGTLQGHTYVMDLKTRHPERAYAWMDSHPFGDDDTSTIWQVRHLPMNRNVWMTAGPGRLGLCHYETPEERTRPTDSGPEGVMGEIRTVCDTPVSPQTVCSFSWSRDKSGLCCWGAMDNTLNVGYVNNLSKLE